MLSFQDKITPVQISSTPSLSFADKIKPIEIERKPETPITQKDFSAMQKFNKYSVGVDEAKNAGIEQIKEGFKQSAESTSPLVKVEGAVKGLAGIANTVFSPIAPLFAPIGKGVDYVADKISNIKAVQNFANTNVGEFTSRMAEDIGNLMIITGAVAGVKTPIKAPVEYVGKTSPVIPPPPKLPPIVAKRVEVLNKLDSQYASMRKASGYSADEGVASRQRVASTDVLADSVDENGVIRTKQAGGAIEQYKAMTLDNAENVVRNLLEREGGKTNLNEVQIRLNEAVNTSGLEGADLKVALNKIKQEISGLRLKADADGNIPNTLLQDAKISTTKGINYQTPPEVKTYRKAIARGYKETIEKNTNINLKINGKEMGVRDINAELAKYLEDLAFLERLDGKRVQGGKLGKYFAQISGNIIGGTVGGAVGGFPGSALGTIVGGEVAGKIKGSIMQNTFGKGTGMVAPKSQIIKGAVEQGKSPRLQLPAPKEGSPRSSIGSGPTINLPARTLRDEGQSYNLGSRNTIYNTPPTSIKNANISKTLPQSKINASLIKEAKKYKTAEEFEKAFTQELKHGQYWHITDNPNFKIDPNLGPRDMVSTGVSPMDKGKLMLTGRLEDWVDTYPNRKYAAQIDMSKVDSKDYYQSARQFGNEFFVKNPTNAKVVKVVPIEEAIKESAKYKKTLPQSKSQLIDIWKKANKK